MADGWQLRLADAARRGAKAAPRRGRREQKESPEAGGDLVLIEFSSLLEIRSLSRP